MLTRTTLVLQTMYQNALMRGCKDEFWQNVCPFRVSTTYYEGVITLLYTLYSPQFRRISRTDLAHAHAESDEWRQFSFTLLIIESSRISFDSPTRSIPADLEENSWPCSCLSLIRIERRVILRMRACD